MYITIIPNKLPSFLGPHYDQLLHPMQGKDSLNVNIAVCGMFFKRIITYKQFCLSSHQLSEKV